MSVQNGNAGTEVPVAAAHAPPPAGAVHAASSGSASGRSEADRLARAQQMVFFDIETNIFPVEVLEFGAVIVDKYTFLESSRYQTLIRPPSNSVSAKATACHGLTLQDVKTAPPFAVVAPNIFDVLDGRIFVGHNVNAFDVPHLTAAFVAAGHPVPVPAATLDTLPLIRRIFGKRAGDCKMATLGNFFGLGQEKHRAIEDSEMTLQVLRSVALNNLLERELPQLFPAFVEPPKQPKAPKAAATSPTSSSPDAAVDALGVQLQATSFVVDSGDAAPEPKKQKAKKAKAPVAAATPAEAAAAAFIDATLLPAVAAPVIGNAAAASVDEWHVVSGKHAKAEKAAKDAAAAAIAAKKLKKLKPAGQPQQPRQQQQQQQQQKAVNGTSAPVEPAAAAPAPSVWLKVAKGIAPTGAPTLVSSAARTPATPAVASAPAPTPAVPSKTAATPAATVAPAAATVAPAAATQPVSSPATATAASTAPVALTSKSVSASPALSGVGSPSLTGVKSPLSASAPTFRPSQPNTPSGSPVLKPAAGSASPHAIAPQASPTNLPASAWAKPQQAASQPQQQQQQQQQRGQSLGSLNAHNAAVAASAAAAAAVSSPPGVPFAGATPEVRDGPATGAYLNYSRDELRALEAAIDVYVQDQTLACAVAYNGGAKPGRTHILKNFRWQKRPHRFEAIIHQSKHGEVPVAFSVNKCISLTRKELSNL